LQEEFLIFLKSKRYSWRINTMNEKHMHIKKIVVPTLTMAIIASQLLGCGAMSQSDLLKMINSGDNIEIEIAVPENYKDADESTLAWIILASLTNQEQMRKQWDDTLKITLTADGKDGCLYVDTEGNNENNNTLRVVLHNKYFVKLLEDKDIMDALAKAADVAYTDVNSTENEDKAFYMALNGYFNILPDSKDGSANADDAISRKEFMTMVARAELPVDEKLSASEEFNKLVGKSEFNTFAEQESDYSYLDKASKSLNNKTYNGVMSRGEAYYMIVSRFFADDLSKVGSISAQFNDCKDGGNIAEKQKFIEDGKAKDYYRDYEMVYALHNPDDGCPSAIYNAMKIAYNKGLVDADTRWDEGITKYEAIKLIVEALKQETGIPQFDFSVGNIVNAEQATENTADNTEVTTEDTKQETENKAEATENKTEATENKTEATGSDLGNGTGISHDDGVSEDEMINQLGEEAEIEVKAPDYKIEDVKPTTYYATQNCNVRSGPSTNYDVVAKLKTNQQVTVIGKVKADNGKSWCIIKTNDKKNPIQMVSGSLLSTKKIEIPKKPSNKSASASSGRHKNSGTTAYQQNQDGLEYDEHEENDCKFANGMRYCTFTSGPEMEAGGVCVECDVCYMQAE